MSTSGSSKTPLAVIHRSKITGPDEGHNFVCAEFRQARHPFKWRKYMCAKCGALLDKHRMGKAKTKTKDIREEHLPPRKRLVLRYKREQKALSAAAAESAREKGKEEGELEEGEISWSPDATITKGKRAPRRRCVDAP